jgi:hypothetical protein
VVRPSDSLYRFASQEDWGGGSQEPPFGATSREREDLPFKVEIWDEAGNSVEQVLAVTANGSIGYAAYYAATREFPQRMITLRHKDRVLSRWNGREH